MPRAISSLRSESGLRGSGAELSASDAAIVSVELRAPAAGRVSVIATWTYLSDRKQDDLVRCSISTGEALDPDHAALATTHANSFPGSAARNFVVEKGKSRFNLVCRSGNDAGSQVRYSSIGAIFTPMKN